MGAAAARHLGWDETECPFLPPTGADGTPPQLARAHRTVLPAALIRPTEAGTRLASRQRHDSEWTVTARGLRAIPIGLGREGRREPTVRVAKLRGGLPRLPTAIQR